MLPALSDLSGSVGADRDREDKPSLRGYGDRHDGTEDRQRGARIRARPSQPSAAESDFMVGTVAERLTGDKDCATFAPCYVNLPSETFGFLEPITGCQRTIMLAMGTTPHG